jgi:DNA invertase Pin-like site-specific DNA recombinase
MSARIGYIRVSCRDQHTERQEIIMQQLNVSKVFIEKISGKTANRPELQNMLEYIRDGDTLIIESLSRLARSTKDLLEIIDKLNTKGVSLISQKESIDTSTATGRFFLTVTAALSTLERESMLERQREGLNAAIAAGRKLGRRPDVYDKNLFENLYTEWKSGAITATLMRKTLNMPPSSFYRRVKLHELQYTAHAAVIAAT